MTPETAILRRVVERLDRVNRSAAVDLNGLAPAPTTLQAFDALDDRRQSAARALLKSFEQVQDQLARAFRAIPPLMGEDTERWFARDHADFMEKLGVLDDASAWGRIVRLRNSWSTTTRSTRRSSSTGCWRWSAPCRRSI